MNHQYEPDLTQICRTCLYKAEPGHEVDKDRTLLSIYEFLPPPVECESTQQIVELLINIAPQLHIPKMVESMPQMICGRCLEQLRQAHQFQQMCLSADSHMQQLQLDYGAVEMKSIFSTVAQEEQETILAVADPLEAANYLKLELGAVEVMQEVKTEVNSNDDVQFDIIYNSNIDPTFVMTPTSVLHHEESNDSMISAFSSVNTNASLPTLVEDASDVAGMPLILNGKYFKIIETISNTSHQKVANGVVAACQICARPKSIRGSIKVTSNFVQHLKQTHRQEYDQFILERNQSTKRPRNFVQHLKPTHRQEYDQFLLERNQSTKRLRKGGPKQVEFDEKVLKFVVDTFSSLTIVDHPSFIALFDNPSLNVPCQKQLTKLLDMKYDFLKSHLREKMQDVPNVCTTADIWSTKKRSFLGYTCHWIDATFERHSIALACTRIMGSRSFDKIADVIHHLNAEFNLNEGKIVSTITDNEFELQCNDNISEDESEADGDDDIMQLSQMPTFSNNTLPKHYRFSSHTLNLLATTDFMNLLKCNKRAQEKHDCLLQRCSTIWNKCNRPKSTEAIQNLLGCSLKTPCATRWNSLFDALKQLLLFKDQLDNLCILLGVTKLDSTDIDYLEEYCTVMQPLAVGLDFLQKENNMFYGYFAPTLITLKVKWRRMKGNSDLNYLKDIVSQMEDALVERFGDYFTMVLKCHDAFVAAIACPDIKMKFAPALRETATEWSDSKIKAMFLSHLNKFEPSVPPMPTKSEKCNAFDFGESPDETTSMENISAFNIKELNRYLDDDDETLNCLSQYPTIKELFLKYNTPLPSSAPVERLFRYAGIVNDNRRQQLTDDHFERLVILKANHIF